MKVPYMELIINADKALSGHNTQRRKFEIGEINDKYLTDYVRASPVEDAGNHTVFINPYLKK